MIKMYHSSEERRYGIPKLNNSNYFIWKQQVEMALVKEELWEVLEEPTPDNPDANWSRKNKLAMATIGLMIGEKHLVHIKHEVTAIGIWRKLERTHQRDNIGTRLMLYRKLFTAKYIIGENMEDHLAELMITAEQLQDRGYPVPPEILCAAMMGSLPKDYNPLITTIEGRSSDDINVEYVRAKIMEEATRQKHTTTDQNIALNTEDIRTTNRPRSSAQCYYCKKIGHIRRDCRLLQRHDAHQPMQGTRTSVKNKTDYPARQQKIKITTRGEYDDYPESPERQAVKLTPISSIQRAMIMNNHESPADTKRWILDTGAGSHMCQNIKDLTEVTKLEQPISIITASGQPHEVTRKGKHIIQITDSQGQTTDLVMKDVLHVPQLTDNLISISRLDQEGLEIFFKDKKCWIIYNNNKYLMGNLKDNLYVHVEEEKISHAKICKHVWHQRLGHRDTNHIKRTQQIAQPKGFNIDECQHDKLCDVCQITKKHQKKFESVKTRVPDKPFHTLHADLCGPITPQSIGGNRYILSIIDDYSRFTKVYPIAHKHQSAAKIKQFIEEGINIFNRRPLILRTDGGGEFQNNNLNDYLVTRGIKHHLSLPYLHQENGMIERYNRTLLEGVRALLKEAKFPDNLWAEMANTSTYLNNLIMKTHQTKTPFELWYGHPPSYEHLKVIGSKCYFLNTDPKRGKLDDRGIPGILIGYGNSKHFYRILNLNDNTIRESRGVTFEEEICPFQLKKFNIEHPANNSDVDEPDTNVPDIDEHSPEIRKSQRYNQGKPPQALTYDERGNTNSSKKDWYETHNLKGQSTNLDSETLGEC